MDWDTLALDARMSSMGRSTQVTLPRVSLLTLCSTLLRAWPIVSIYGKYDIYRAATLSSHHPVSASLLQALTVLQNICDAKIVDNEGGEHV